MDHLLVFLGCGISAAGTYLMLARQERAARVTGGLVAAGGLAWLLSMILGLASPDEQRPDAVFYVFAFIAVAAAARMITHHRPVYSALYFVLVVVSSAAVFLLLEAEFMAFALVIVYAGAILITYLFVIMLAQQAPTEGQSREQAAEYDRLPREPLAAVGVGFLMMALIGQVIFDRGNFGPGAAALPLPASRADRLAEMADEIALMPAKQERLVEAFRAALPDLPAGTRLGRIDLESVEFIQPPSGRVRRVTFEEAGLSPADVESLLTTNLERVGLALVHRFPVSLELAGVILLMAMFGAVVLARKQVELGEDEKREAAGMRRLTVDPDDARPGAAGGGA